MKNVRVCPKCGGTDILRIEGDVRGYGAGNNVFTGATILSAVPVERYLCGTCGYSEEWIDRQNIPQIRKCKRVHRA